MDKQAIFGSANNKAMHLLRREAQAASLLPASVGAVSSQTARLSSASVEPNAVDRNTTETRGTVKESAIFWLCHVATVCDGKSVGLTNDEVLERVRAEHPSAKTTLKGIAYYATKIRNGERGYEGELPQIRPRASR